MDCKLNKHFQSGPLYFEVSFSTDLFVKLAKVSSPGSKNNLGKKNTHMFPSGKYLKENLSPLGPFKVKLCKA